MTRVPEARQRHLSEPTRIPAESPSKPPSKTPSSIPSKSATYPGSQPGSHLSKSPSKPPSDLPSKCHASRRSSRKLPRKPFEAAPRDPSVLPSEHATCPRIPQAGRIPPDAARARHLSRVPKPRQFPPRMPCESSTCPGAHTETLTGRLPDHPPGAFRKRHLSPSTGPPSPRKPPSVPRA